MLRFIITLFHIFYHPSFCLTQCKPKTSLKFYLHSKFNSLPLTQFLFLIKSSNKQCSGAIQAMAMVNSFRLPFFKICGCKDSLMFHIREGTAITVIKLGDTCMISFVNAAMSPKCTFHTFRPHLL